MHCIITAIVMLATFTLWWLPVFVWRRNDDMRRKAGVFLFWVNLPIYYCAIAPAFFPQPRLPYLWLQIIGGVLILYAATLSILMIIPKIKAGGPGYDPTKLLTKGVFRWVRHPQIAGILAFSFGFACWQGALYHLWLSLGYLIMLLIHIQMEERLLLLPMFGEEYNQYRQKSWAILPFVY